jgi:S-adenosylmethionine hydrolase
MFSPKHLSGTIDQSRNISEYPTLANSIEGSVEKIGESGNLITNIAIDQVADLPPDDSVTVTFGGHETHGVHPTEHEQPMGTLVASRGESGFLEIEIVGISIAEMLGIKVGEAVIVQT